MTKNSTSKIKEPIIHRDMLGVEIAVGKYVAASYQNTMHVCKVIKISPKMITIDMIFKNNYNNNSK